MIVLVEDPVLGMALTDGRHEGDYQDGLTPD